MDDLVVQPGVWIPERELEFSTSRSGGPGGQHVNTTDSRVTITWNLDRSEVLRDETRARLRARLGSRVAADGSISLHVDTHRSQLRNKEEALQRLAELLRAALVVPKRRRATAPSRAAVERRLVEKRHASEKKRRRGPSDAD